jgi:PAS domain S-box-containing protein
MSVFLGLLVTMKPLLFLFRLLLIGVLFSAGFGLTPAVSAEDSDLAGAFFYLGSFTRFEHLTSEDGLSQNAGLAIYQDSLGFMQVGWIRLLALAVLLALVYGVFQWRLKTVRVQKIILEEVVSQRTEDLRLANRQLENEIVLRKQAEEALSKRASAELRASQERFRAMFDNMAVGIAVMSLDRHILAVNQTAERITGYKDAEMRNIDPTELIYVPDRYMDRELFEELVKGERDQYLMEKRYLRKDGGMFWGRLTYSLVRDEQGKPDYLIGLIEDISEEKRAQEKLAAQASEYRRKLERRVEERTRELQQEIEQRQRAEQALAEKAAEAAVTAERTRLARDLHDAVTQTLFSASLIAEVLPDLWKMNQTEAFRRLDELRQLTRGALAEMRTLLVELRPNALVEIPLPDLLRLLCESLIGRARLPIQLNVEGQYSLPPNVQVGIYRITQEALNNVFKHAKATQVIVNLCMKDGVRLVVIDNGCGFDPSTVPPDHLGIKIMSERAEAFGASCSVYSEPGEGTQVTVIWQENGEKGN